MILMLQPLDFLSSAAPQELPLGYTSNLGSDTIHPPVGHPCTLFPSNLQEYISYHIGGPYPDDELPSQKLLLRCHQASPIRSHCPIACGPNRPTNRPCGPTTLARSQELHMLDQPWEANAFWWLPGLFWSQWTGEIKLGGPRGGGLTRFHHWRGPCTEEEWEHPNWPRHWLWLGYICCSHEGEGCYHCVHNHEPQWPI